MAWTGAGRSSNRVDSAAGPVVTRAEAGAEPDAVNGPRAESSPVWCTRPGPPGKRSRARKPAGLVQSGMCTTRG